MWDREMARRSLRTVLERGKLYKYCIYPGFFIGSSGRIEEEIDNRI
jgi:hypothetical protein